MYSGAAPARWFVAWWRYLSTTSPRILREEARKVASAVDSDEDEEEPPPPVEKKAGLLDGLDLVLRHSYVFNLLMISTLYEIVSRFSILR